MFISSFSPLFFQFLFNKKSVMLVKRERKRERKKGEKNRFRIASLHSGLILVDFSMIGETSLKIKGFTRPLGQSSAVWITLSQWCAVKPLCFKPCIVLPFKCCG